MERTDVSCVYALLIVASVFADDRLELSAYEYLKNIDNKTLSLGQCPTRLVQYPEIDAYKEPCTLPSRSGESVYRDKVVDSQKIFPVSNASELFHYVGMCEERSAAYFGLLAKDDCLAVHMAEKLSFSSKYATKVFLQHFRPRINVLQPGDPNTPDSFSLYYNNTYYTESIGIGTEEVLLVQMKFPNEQEAVKAQNLKTESKKLSEHLMYVIKNVGLPIKVKVIRFSTSDMEFQTQLYRDHANIFQCISVMEKFEKRTAQVHQELLLGRRSTHLKYGFKAFQIEPTAVPESTSTYMEKKRIWEAVALLQVDANREYATNKRIRKICRLFKQQYTPYEQVRTICLLAKQTLKELKLLTAQIHVRRRNWSTVLRDQQTQFIKQGYSHLELQRIHMKRIRQEMRKTVKNTKFISYLKFK